jgi:hypothetical protein
MPLEPADPPPTLAEMFPEGRTYFYEGVEHAKARAALKASGLDPIMSLQVHVPAEKLAAFDSLCKALGFVFGT